MPLREHEFVFQESQRMLDSVRHLLRPVTAADIQERFHHQAQRLRTLTIRAQPPPPPLLTQPRTLPRPLNPLYFARAPRGRKDTTDHASP